MAAAQLDILVVLGIIGLAILLFFLYVSGIEKVFERIGFSKGEAGTILLLTLLLSGVSIPIFPYQGWWVGISIGGALIPLVVCGFLVSSKRVLASEALIGIVIVSFITYFITRAEQNVGIVADLPWAFAPALAAGFFSLSTFWIDIRKAAPLAYVSGVVGTLVGADIFHLADILAFPAPTGDFNLLSMGGAGIFDLVYLAGIIAVAVDVFVFWVKRQEKKHGFQRVVAEWERGAEGLPYAKDIKTSPPDVKAAPTLRPGRRGRLQQ